MAFRPTSEEFLGKLIRQYESVKGSRGTWEQHWREVGDLILPQKSLFQQSQVKGEKRTRRIFDSTPRLALNRFVATLESLITPRTQKWHGLRASNEALNQIRDVRVWFDEVTKLLFRVRYSTQSTFSSQSTEVYESIGAFGTGAMFVGTSETGIQYKSVHLSEIFFSENKDGVIDRVYRRFPLTVRQAIQAFGGDNLPEKMFSAQDSEQEFHFLHFVIPNQEQDPEMPGPGGMPFLSWIISEQEKKLIGFSGFSAFPYAISRYTTSINEVYGRGPGIFALPEIKMLNEIQASLIRQVHMDTDPPVLLTSDGSLSRFSLKPGAHNHGALDRQGNPLAAPYKNDSNLPAGAAFAAEKRAVIDAFFLVDIFDILQDNPRMTATEVLERAREKGILLSPTIGRMQSEFLAPLIIREIDILATAGVLPPMPDVLIEAEGEFEIDYDSPLTRSQRADEALGTERAIDSAIAKSEVYPEILDNYNPDEIVRIINEANGVPAKATNSIEEVAQIRANRAQLRQAEQLVEALPALAGAAKDMNTATTT